MKQRKQKLLFVIESLSIAGAEKSLVTLLSALDYSKYEVDLQLFAYGGGLQTYLPREVNLLPPFDYVRFAAKGFLAQLFSFDIKKLWARISYSAIIRKGQTSNIDKAGIYWKCVSPCLSVSPKQYDAAIAYSQGIPTFYVAEKVKAKRKLAWINTSYELNGKGKEFQKSFYGKMNHIVLVSDSAYSIFRDVYPEFENRMTVIWDMLNARQIEVLSDEKPAKSMNKSVPCLLTVARLVYDSKGYDISLEACKILRQRNVAFRWYAVGEGPFRHQMEQFIKQNGLEDTFILLGTTPNPYPYIRACDIYVQTSRFEGFGLSIAEARILNRPVVTTEFDAVYNQMVHGKNGLVVAQDPIAVADAVERLLSDKALYETIVSYQKQEKKGNMEEVDKFYRLIEFAQE